MSRFVPETTLSPVQLGTTEAEITSSFADFLDSLPEVFGDCSHLRETDLGPFDQSRAGADSHKQHDGRDTWSLVAPSVSAQTDSPAYKAGGTGHQSNGHCRAVVQKESNRRYQRTFQRKRREAYKQLQAEAPVDRTIVYSLLSLYRSGALNTCPVSFLLQDDVVQPVAHLTSEQVAMFTQDYQQDITLCLEETGQEISGPDGPRLRNLIDQLLCLHTVQARADSTSHIALISCPVTDSSTSTARLSNRPDYSALGTIWQCTQAQMHSLFKARRSYLTTLASISRRRHCLVLTLQSSPAALGANFEEVVASQLTMNHVSKQLQDLQSEGHSAYMLYMKRVAVETLTPWQVAVSMVFTFPHYVEVVAAINAVAKDAGQPSVEEIQDAYLASRTDVGQPLGEEIQGSYLANRTDAGQPSVEETQGAYLASRIDAGQSLVGGIQGSYLVSSTRASSAGEPSMEDIEAASLNSSTGVGEPSIEEIQGALLASSTGVGEPSIEEIQAALLAYAHDSVSPNACDSVRRQVA
ncbi:hypothetical protein WJX82_004805 [Trebouxia sp. C0006]